MRRAVYGAYVPWEEHLQAVALVCALVRWADDLTRLAVRELISILKRLVWARKVQLFAKLVTARHLKRLVWACKVQLFAGLVTARQRRRLLEAETGQRAVYGDFPGNRIFRPLSWCTPVAGPTTSPCWPCVSLSPLLNGWLEPV